mmetsp:Transcript_36316/g.63999  ORF Transcript_36316/g.63999 Transcript_36316/m.63999 type:complete len:327 (+) Transcript_36316:553-1533(+)
MCRCCDLWIQSWSLEQGWLMLVLPLPTASSARAPVPERAPLQAAPLLAACPHWQVKGCWRRKVCKEDKNQNLSSCVWSLLCRLPRPGAHHQWRARTALLGWALPCRQSEPAGGRRPRRGKRLLATARRRGLASLMMRVSRLEAPASQTASILSWHRRDSLLRMGHWRSGPQCREGSDPRHKRGVLRLPTRASHSCLRHDYQHRGCPAMQLVPALLELSLAGLAPRHLRPRCGSLQGTAALPSRHPQGRHADFPHCTPLLFLRLSFRASSAAQAAWAPPAAVLPMQSCRVARSASPADFRVRAAVRSMARRLGWSWQSRRSPRLLRA